MGRGGKDGERDVVVANFAVERDVTLSRTKKGKESGLKFGSGGWRMRGNERVDLPKVARVDDPFKGLRSSQAI